MAGPVTQKAPSLRNGIWGPNHPCGSHLQTHLFSWLLPHSFLLPLFLWVTNFSARWGSGGVASECGYSARMGKMEAKERAEMSLEPRGSHGPQMSLDLVCGFVIKRRMS